MATSPAEQSPCACCVPSSCAGGRSSTVESPSIRVPCSDFISSSAVALDPGRTVAELRELRELTGDEEGARFGRSLFGSSAAAGSMVDQDELRSRRDAGGQALPEVLAAHGVDLDRALEARSRLHGAAAYLELHIEQGPVLEALDLPLGVVLGTFGVERHQITFRGQAAHAGSTPMNKRRDALGA